MVSLPSAAELLAVARETFIMDVNRAKPRSKPRASGIGSCARQIAYMMRNVPPTNDAPLPEKEPSGDADLTAEQGRMAEDLTVALLKTKGIVVANRQIELPPEYPMEGHPDGQLVPEDEASWDDLCVVCGESYLGGRYEVYGPHDPNEPDTHRYQPVGWVAELTTPLNDKDGVTGFEHKHLGRYGYETTFKKGFIEGEPGYTAQFVSYGDALKWDTAYVAVMAQDASSTRGDATANLRVKNKSLLWATRPDWNPKLLTFTFRMAQFQGLAGLVRSRAKWFMDWFAKDGDPDQVLREEDPEALKQKWVAIDGEPTTLMLPTFPCSYCPWYERCVEAGQGKVAAPPLWAQ